MARFTYTALSESGTQSSGTIDADSQAAAVRQLIFFFIFIFLCFF